jgi:hypothetical protein
MARDITIRYVGDDTSAIRASKRVREANDRLSQNVGRMHTGLRTKFGSLGVTFRRFGQTAALGIAGAGFLAVKLGTDFVKAAEESNKISAQTNAVLESTGGVARVTARQVEKLTEKLSIKAGVDDELIQSGANVLLTFTNIRNEVGKGNDIFDQAAAVALDMSTALGTDLQGSIIQVGKALQDPVRGITALRRVGVNFSEAQIEVIKKLVETGDLLGAQKLILQELTTEFGGSAAAQADASDKLRVAWDNLKEKLGQELLPLVDKFSTWMVKEGIPKIQELAGWITGTLVPAFGEIKTWVQDNVLPPLETMWGVFKDDILPIFKDVTAWINDHLVPAFGALKESISGSNDEAKKSGPSWTGWAVAVGAAALAIGAAVALISKALYPVAAAFGFLATAATNAFTMIVQRLPFVHIASLAFVFRDQIVGAFRTIRDGIVNRWRETWSLVSESLRRWWGVTAEFFQSIPERIKRWFGNARKWLDFAGAQIMKGLKDGLLDVWRDIKDWFLAIPNWIKEHKGPISADRALLRPAGRAIMSGFLDGLRRGTGSALRYLKGIGATVTDLFSSWFGGGQDMDFSGLAKLVGSGSGVERWREVALAALAYTGSPASWIDSLLRRMQQESGGNPRAINLWDVNAQRGDPSRGLMQTIGATFNAYAGELAGRGIYDPFANIVASIRYANARYGSAPTGWNRSGGYATGGIVDRTGPALVHAGEGVFTPDQLRALGGRRGGTVINNISFAGAIISSKSEAERWVVDALRRAGENGRPITIRGRPL